VNGVRLYALNAAASSVRRVPGSRAAAGTVCRCHNPAAALACRRAAALYFHMDLHHLRHFIAVAEEQHFGRAAARLGMKQPPLSQSIQRLESSLGVSLLERTSKGVHLTAAGRALLQEARTLVDGAEAAQRRVLLAASGERTRINLGYMPWSMVRAVPQAMRRFAAQWPGVKIKLYERSSQQQVAALRAGNLDLGIISLRNAESAGLETVVVEHSEMALAVPAGWPLAQRRQLRLAEAAALPFIIFSPHLSPNSHAAILDACEAAGFAPQVVHETGQPFTMLNMVANELGVAMIQSTAALMPLEGVRIVPLADAPASLSSPIALAWDPKARTPALAALIHHLEQAAAGSTTPASPEPHEPADLPQDP